MEEGELSEREREILRLLATGASNKEIAARLVISPNTVKVHLRNIFAKIGVVSRTEATLYALRTGLVEHPAAPLELPPETVSQPPAPPQAPTRRRIPGWLTAAAVLLLAVVFTAGVLLRSTALPQTSTQPQTAPQRWQTDLTLPEGHAAAAVVVYDNSLYLIGGQTPAGVSAALLRYHTGGADWQPLADKPTPVSQAQAAVLGEKIYVPGGEDAAGQPTARVEVYDPRAGRWQRAADLPAARSRYALATLEGRLYLFGGWDGRAAQNTLWIYDPAADSWQTGASLPAALMQAAAIPLEGRIYLLGGSDGARPLADVRVYHPARDRAGEQPWEALPPMPAARSAMGAALLANQIYLVGGQTSAGDDPPAWQFLPQSGQWLSFEGTPQPAGSSPALVPLDNRLHLLGGLRDGSPQSAHLTYQAIYTILIPLVQ